ncbi:MAG TPA: hypothetical protein VFN78_06015 [Ktedonobacterales bacterium]|nr:hypothetical protein [Ktedonobacterales bacterium]
MDADTRSVVVVRAAREDDADITACLAATKRAEYEVYSPVFWRRAADDRGRHLPFLRSCLRDPMYLSFTAESGGEPLGIILGKRGAAPPPFQRDPEPTCFVDDFFVARPSLWASVGGALLAEVAEAAHAQGAARVIVVTAQRDIPKRTFLLDEGYSLAAAWWVHPIAQGSAAISIPAGAEEGEGIEAVVASPPPVYDPGGPVALALSLGDTPAAQVARFGHWVVASHAALAIVPVRVADLALAEELAAHGYEIASEWFVRSL